MLKILSLILALLPSHQNRFNSPNEAVKDILNSIIKNHPDHVSVEYGGLIYANHGKYYASDPIRGNGSMVKITLSEDTDNVVVGFYHTHPHNQYSKSFSYDDLKIGNDYMIQLYLLNSNDTIITYDPKIRVIREL